MLFDYHLLYTYDWIANKCEPVLTSFGVSPQLMSSVGWQSLSPWTQFTPTILL